MKTWRSRVEASPSSLLLVLGLAAFAVCSSQTRALAAADEFRAMWVSRFGNPVEWVYTDPVVCRAHIDEIMEKLGANKFNAVIFQMRGQADTLYPSPYEPWSPLVSPDGNTPPGWEGFDPMAYAINKAHENGLEFHAYLNAHVCWGGADPPTYCGSPTDRRHLYWQHCNVSDSAHRDWVVHNASGTPVGYDGEYVWIAPGVPDFQAYWRKQIMYVVTQYDGSDPVTRPRIDGVHFDRMRTPGTEYSHDPISEARRLSGVNGANPANLSFGDWTRDQFTRTLCDLYAQINENHSYVKVSSAPLGMHSGSRYTEYGYPTSDCGYGGYGYSCKYQDAQGWLAAGAQDFVVPQIYWADSPWRTSNPHFSQILPDWITHNAGRHIYPGCNVSATGPGLLSEVSVTRTMGGQGDVIWSYSGFNNGNYWSLYSGPGGPYEEPANVPAMPWKDTPTEGIILGTVSNGTDPIVDVQIRRTGLDTYAALSSADGIYSFLKVPPGTYTLTYRKTGYAQTTREVTVSAGQVARVADVVLSGNAPPTIFSVQATGVTNNAATITWTTDSASSSQVEYGLTTSYGNSSALDTTAVTSHSVGLSGLAANTLYHYRVISTNAYGTTNSTDYTFTTAGPPTISNVAAGNITASGATITWTTNSAANSQVRYGLTSSYGSQTTLDPANVTAHSVTLSGLSPNTLYHYQALSANAYGSASSTDYTFTTTAPVTEIVIDNTDAGWANTSPSGSWNPGSSSVVPKIGTNYLYYAGSGSTSSITRSCTWTPTIPQAAYYDVYVYYQLGTNRNSAAPYTVFYSGGSVTSIQNQYSSTPNQGGWFLVGQDLPFAAGTSGYVQLANNSADTNLVSADAAKFVLKSVIQPPTVPPPQPLPQSVCPGAAATFSVTATGSGTLLYQWQKNSVSLSDGGHYSGVTTPTLTVSTANSSDVGDYRCVVSNVAGSANSNQAALTLKAATSITQQPQPLTVDAGTTATFSVTGTGDGTITYQWQKAGVNLSDDGRITGTATATMTIASAGSGDAAAYRCVVVAGCGSATSETAALTVNASTYAPSDFDHDGDVDLIDFSFFQMCFAGPNQPPAQPDCDAVDLDDDADVDLADFSVFQGCFNGPNNPPACP